MNKFIDQCIKQKFPIYHNYSMHLGNNILLENINETIYQIAIIIIEGFPLTRLFEEIGNNAFKIFLNDKTSKRKEELTKRQPQIKSLYQNKVNLLKDIEKDDLLITKNYLEYADIEIDLNC